MANVPTQEPSFEDQFRESLKEAIVVVKTVAPLCKSPKDLVGILELALENDGQLAWLIEKCSPLTFRSS